MTDAVPDWDALEAEHPPLLVAELEAAYERGSVSFTAQELANAAGEGDEDFTAAQAQVLLEDAGPWLTRVDVPQEPDPDFPDAPPEVILRFEWRGEPRRRLGWLLLVHGMNTKGSWQQYLGFDLGLWSGKGVPTFIHKYGHIVLGVLLPWRRNKLKRDLRERIAALSAAAEDRNVRGRPDVVAHSFGTWLLGHVLRDELQKEPGERIALGRVILTGCVLRPDFDWAELQEAGIVGDVLNHFGTKDPVVPWAHWTIWDSGPSGRRGFDGEGAGPAVVANVAAPGYGHSRLFSSDEERYRAHSQTWKPFLTSPAGRAARNLEVSDPDRPWVPAWWPLRGTLFPIAVVPLLLAALVLGIVAVVEVLDATATVLIIAVAAFGIAAAALAVVYLAQKLWCRLRHR